jgi:hypothetical protein
VKSHLFHLLLYATIVAVFFAVLLRIDQRARLKVGAALWLAMVGGALGLAWLMFPFPR